MQINQVRSDIKLFSAKAVADETGVHENTIFRFRRGGNIGLDNFNKLVEFLGKRSISADQSAE